jgi:hypothetical protein
MVTVSNRSKRRRIEQIIARVVCVLLAIAVVAVLVSGIVRRGPSSEQRQVQQACRHTYNTASCIERLLNARHDEQDR